jgi:hypothetical protein
MDYIVVAACVPNDYVSFGGGKRFRMRVLASVGMVVACWATSILWNCMPLRDGIPASCYGYDSVLKRENGHMWNTIE